MKSCAEEGREGAEKGCDAQSVAKRTEFCLAVATLSIFAARMKGRAGDPRMRVAPGPDRASHELTTPAIMSAALT